MQGSIAQAAALVCHANGSLRHGPAAPFFPENSTCQFCESIQFVDATRMRQGRREENPIAGNPAAWLEHLSRSGTRRLTLHDRDGIVLFEGEVGYFPTAGSTGRTCNDPADGG